MNNITVGYNIIHICRCKQRIYYLNPELKSKYANKI